MTPLVARLAIAAVLAWTRIYTWRLRAAVRDARREEIESDLWESAHDPEIGGRASLAAGMFGRMLAGIPDDLAWRWEHMDAMKAPSRFRVALAGAAAGALAAWFAIGSLASQLPAPPSAPGPRFVAAPPPPPPPPPPSDPRAPAASAEFHPTYGETFYTIAGNIPAPKKIKDARPVYPPIAEHAGVSGDVVVEAAVDDRGRVTNARIVQSIPMLDQAAIDAVRRWRFEPAVLLGAPAPMVIVVTARFTPRPVSKSR